METTKRVWVAATLDTKGDEANYVCTLLEVAGLPVTLVDVSTSGKHALAPTRAHLSPEDVAAHTRDPPAVGQRFEERLRLRDVGRGAVVVAPPQGREAEQVQRQGGTLAVA